MTNLAKTLKLLLASHGWNASDLSRGAGLTHSLVSRVLCGTNSISKARLARLTKFFAKGSKEEAASVLAAHLLDQAVGIKGAELVSIRVIGLDGKVEHHVVD